MALVQVSDFTRKTSVPSIKCLEVLTKPFTQDLITLLDWVVSPMSELFFFYFRFKDYAFGFYLNYFVDVCYCSWRLYQLFHAKHKASTALFET